MTIPLAHQLTKDENDNQKDQKQQNLVKNTNRLANILHALANGFALSAHGDNLADHLIQTNVAIAVLVKRGKGLVGLFSELRAEHLLKIFRQQRFAALDAKRHPDAASQSF